MFRVDRLWQSLVVFLIFGVVALLTAPVWSGKDARTRATKRDLFLLGVVATGLFCALLPTFSKDYLFDPDEAFYVSAAKRLSEDPVFYRSVDTGTSGALNIYPLTLPALVGGTISYVSARLVGWILLSGTFALLYFAFLPLIGSNLAQLALLPLFACTLLFGHFDFLHYSSERVSLFLLAACVLLLSRLFFERTRLPGLHLFGVGIACGAVCCAKLQGIPIAGVLFVAAALVVAMSSKPISERVKSLGLLLSGLIAVPAIFVIVYYKNGVFDAFYRSYIAQNLSYADRTGLGMGSKLWWTLAAPFEMPDTKWFALGLVAFTLLSLGESFWTKRTERAAGSNTRHGKSTGSVSRLIFSRRSSPQYFCSRTATIRSV